MVKDNTECPGPKLNKELTCAAFKRRKNNEIALVLGLYLGLTLLFVYTIPQSVLSAVPFLRRLVDNLGGVVSGVERFGQWSAFPEVAQLTYSLQIVLIPVLVVWGVVSLKIKLKEVASKKNLLRALMALLFFGSVGFALVFVAYPASPDLGGMFGRISDSAYASRFWFSVHSSWLTFAASICFIFFYIATRDLIVGSMRRLF
ncbi:hypothetical protein [Thioalkalivibrio sp. ALMg11]|uniref:hypothetical protein n=1 Tax=Thioalkalivibrio sp. ALMg11 TaxID=1158165 RepID=UPI0012DF87C6|nr:hypothetical protein [Thioalkalivibrio sp. ALMg11]